ncbi:MAG TPA: hypothetical protein VF546_16735 [Pyrinomonadaceae bacterium]|jgi:hypothetical protein
MPRKFSRRALVRRAATLAFALCVGAGAAQGARAQQPKATPAPAQPTPTQGRSAAPVQTPTPAPAAPTAPPPAAPAPGTPTRVVLDFYGALRQRKFREAFAMSVWRAAIDGLTPAEFDELRPEFERMAAAVPERIEINGEQLSGETATVFARVGDEPGAEITPIPLVLQGGAWSFGSREQQAEVARYGKEFFPHARIEQHHEEIKSTLLVVANAEATYAAQHGGVYADLAALVASKPSLRDDVDAITGPLGYTFRVTLTQGGKGYAVQAEPVQYGRTGLLSYYMDAGGYHTKDNGGKPFTPPGAKR